MKGIILAGGKGTRLFPLTKVISKQLLPIHDKPMVYYSLSILMLMGIREILIISTERDILFYKELLDSGEQLGINLNYDIQYNPEGIPQCFQIASNFIENDHVSLILGDNIFWGHGLGTLLRSNKNNFKSGCTIFAYEVQNPKDYGVIEFDNKSIPKNIIEKPQTTQSNWAITGLYFYDNKVIEYSKDLKKSSRGEYEISDLNNIYLKNNSLKVEKLGRGHAWLDTGTFTGIQNASSFVESVQNRQGFKIACIEEVAWRNGWINEDELLKIAKNYTDNDYGKYLKKLITI